MLDQAIATETRTLDKELGSTLAPSGTRHGSLVPLRLLDDSRAGDLAGDLREMFDRIKKDNPHIDWDRRSE